MRKSFAISLYNIALMLCFLSSVSVAFANPSYTVTPLVIDIEAKPRDILKKQIVVTNTGIQPLTIYPTVNNISVADGGAIEEFKSASVSDRTQSLAAWVEISRRGVSLPAGESYTFDLTLRINPQPVPGTYHALIGFGHGDTRDYAEELVKNGKAPGTMLTVTINEDKKEFLKLSKFIVERFVTKTDNQAALYTFTNPGDEPVTPSGEIILYDATGKEVGTVKVNEEGIEIPPASEHTFNVKLPVEGLFGKYKAFLTVEYGSAQKASVQDTSYFYAMPGKTLVTICILLLLFVGLMAWYLHKKYFDTEFDDTSDQIMLRVRATESKSYDHDINLKP
jgi:hypothetical protein